MSKQEIKTTLGADGPALSLQGSRLPLSRATGAFWARPRCRAFSAANTAPRAQLKTRKAARSRPNRCCAPSCKEADDQPA